MEGDLVDGRTAGLKLISNYRFSSTIFPSESNPSPRHDESATGPGAGAKGAQ
jgi:hypothetical protein